MIKQQNYVYKSNHKCRSWFDLLFQLLTLILLVYVVVRLTILAFHAEAVFLTINTIMGLGKSSVKLNETYWGLPQDRPLNIAHRGSSGMRPEHTVAAYQLAVDQGADIIECDLAVTKDLKLVCSHDPYLNATTNVHSHPEFNSRVQTYTFGAVTMTDYFIFDFTLAELKTLRKVQNRKYRDQSYNGLFPIATFDEYVAVAKFAPRTIGIYPETKQPALFNHFITRHNVTMEDLLLEALESHGYTSRDSPCFIQSFDETSLQYMAKRTDLPLVHLTDTVPSNEKLTEIASYCYGMGVSKNLIVQVSPSSNQIVSNTNFIQMLHSKNLKVHAYTFRNEEQFLAYDYGDDPYREYERFTNLGLDGLFTDFPWSLANYMRFRNNSQRVPSWWHRFVYSTLLQ